MSSNSDDHVPTANLSKPGRAGLLPEFAAKIRESHSRLVASVSQALLHARDCGEYLAKAHQIWREQRANGGCKQKWEQQRTHAR
jgi:hypothetical protein